MSSAETAQRTSDVSDDRGQEEQLMRQLALRMLATAEEEERARRISEEERGNVEKSAVYDQLITVQEDLVRTINIMKVLFIVTITSTIIFKITALVAVDSSTLLPVLEYIKHIAWCGGDCSLDPV